MKTFIDLFAGIGGFRIALENHNLNCVFSSENDHETSRMYYKNFGEKPQGDITTINEKAIPAHDILCAGFPCQSFSISGSRHGFNDNRGQLFYEIVRITNYHKPKLLLLENVSNILRIQIGYVFRTIRNEIESMGYTVYCSLLNASNYGIPQARTRVYFTCLKKGIGLSFKQPTPTYDQIFLRDVLDKHFEKKLIINRKDIHFFSVDDPEPSILPIKIGYIGKGRQGERIYHPNGHAITMSANGGGMGSNTGLYLIDNHVRKLSITESKRLMGFSESFYVSPGRRGYKQLGNAVIPKMVSLIYNGVNYNSN